MADRIVRISDDFWNFRGSFKLAGVIEIGTQASLVRRKSGGFVLLDAYTFTGDVAREVMALTDQGAAVESILNLHPFHTVHVPAVAAQFPDARLYGTERHVAKAPKLRWESLRTDDPQLHALFADDLTFDVPRGVDFISEDQSVHFSSVLAFHPGSRSLHVDDTLTWLKLPFVSRLIFHPKLRPALERRAGAVADFRAWAQALAERCEQVDHIFTAHTRPLVPSGPDAPSVAARVRQALERVEKTLRAHDKRFG